MARGRRKSTVKLSLGHLEMDVMPIVWRSGEVTVRQVFEQLYESQRLAYTTVMTVMNRLAIKGVLEVDKLQSPFLYRAAVDSKELAAHVVDDVVNRLLEGAAAPIVLHYLEHGKISATEHSEISTLLRGQTKG